jgi:hypothetical protein
MRTMLLVLLVGCGGQKGDPGPAGPTGAEGTVGPQGTIGAKGSDGQGGAAGAMGFAGPSGPTGPRNPSPSPLSCTPGAAFCFSSSRVANCTVTGADAVLGDDCSMIGSLTNPANCATSNCPPGQAACCRRSKPIGAWSLTQPEAISGVAYVAGALDLVSMTETCTSGGLAVSAVTFTRTISTCPSNYLSITATINRSPVSTVVPGQTITLPNGDFVLSVTGSSTCIQWSGTAKIDSDPPDWSLTINATCATGAPFSVSGTFSGSE